MGQLSNGHAARVVAGIGSGHRHLLAARGIRHSRDNRFRHVHVFSEVAPHRDISVCNKRCLKLPFESVSKPLPNGSNDLFIGLRAILACRHLGRKLFFGIYAPNGQNDGFG